MTALAIALGGALGAVLRYSLVLLVGAFPITARWPWAVFAANLIGALAVGLVWGYIEARGMTPLWRDALVYGVLGGFTTFSAFTWDVLRMFEAGEWLRALAYIMASVVLCIVLARWGWQLTRHA